MAISLIGLAELFGVSFSGPGKGLRPHLEPLMASFWCLRFHSSLGMAMEEINSNCPVQSQDHHIDAKDV